MDFIHRTVTLAICRPASIGTIPANTPLEKTTATIASIDSVVFPRRAIAAYFAGNIQKAPFEDKIQTEQNWVRWKVRGVCDKTDRWLKVPNRQFLSFKKSEKDIYTVWLRFIALVNVHFVQTRISVHCERIYRVVLRAHPIRLPNKRRFRRIVHLSARGQINSKCQ